MAQLKRRRRIPSNGESETEALSSDSEASVDQNKRRRTSRTPSSDISSDDEDFQSTYPLQTQPSFIPDEDELELQQTQIIVEKWSQNQDVPNTPAECGIIERIDCYNFMCHEHFSVELGPLINFIVGKNGSGKSAILTALTICLGGKASVTNRGQSLKNFIKEGKDSSTIAVRIKNQGDGAYMPEEYGKSITVERSFSKNGVSGFKIKSETGRIVSTKRSELDAITDYFNLQIDNPMNVLSQDMARQFLSTSSPAEKYKFFVKGVQLEQLDQDYRCIEESIEQLRQRLDSQLEDLKILKENRDKAKRKMDISDQYASLRERVKNLRGQMAWAQVEEQERGRDAMVEKIARMDEKIAQAEAAIQPLDEALQQAGRELEAATQTVNEAKAGVDRLNDEKEEIKNRHNETRSELRDHQSDERKIYAYLQAAQKTVKEKEREIAEETQRLADLDGGNFARREQELEEQKAEVERARERLQEHQRDEERLQAELRKAQEQVERNRAPIEKQKYDIKQAENTLDALKRDRGQTEAAFHPNMAKLLQEIRRETGFSRPPIGPIGQHVRLLKPKWSPIIEQALGTSLTGFIVTSKSDANILNRVMKKVDCFCPIFIGGSDRLDTSAHEPDPKYDTVLRVLEIDNEAVRRLLIINHGIEQMLLIEDVDEATSTLFDGPPLRNVKRCFSIDQRDRRRGFHLAYGRHGQASSTPVAAFEGRPRMKSDIDAQIRIQRETVESLKANLRSMEQTLAASRAAVERCKQALSAHKRRENELKVAVQRQEDRVDELTEALERNTVQDGRLEVLKTTLKEAQDELRTHQGSLEDSKSAIRSVQEKLDAIAQELNAKEREIAAQMRQVKVAEDAQTKANRQRQQALSRKNQAVEKVDELKRQRQKMIEEKNEYALRVQSYSEQASIVSPRVPVDPGETPASLDKKLERLHNDLRRYDRQIGASREQIAADLLAAQTAYRSALKQIKELRALERHFQLTVLNRRERWFQFRAHISSRAKAQFTYLLSERSFRGRLLADHDNKLLDLQVEPDITKDSTGRDAKTLSGGEKSFSQVCLLLALWEAMGSPIRCLDEFDVYMDSVNRKMAIDMLMLAARRSVGRQFVLITPGSRAEISLAPDVRVKELAEPERGQRTLSFRAS
ncbi:hypothetical protein VTN49DRAFT_1560 [Thermomyces lanuginosus]|uniref:uncharacterized protein n=1 Tax=Thermomyces lanuginosus TaxID=5541 RepID=UPI00374311B5